ncbi:hypothetical protein ACFQ0B_55445 [Nonomuraea thailandensis]
MMDAPAHVRVSDHAFGLLDGGDIPIRTADHSTGLIVVMSAGALLYTGIDTGTVHVAITLATQPLGLVNDADTPASCTTCSCGRPHRHPPRSSGPPTSAEPGCVRRRPRHRTRPSRHPGAIACEPCSLTSASKPRSMNSTCATAEHRASATRREP